MTDRRYELTSAQAAFLRSAGATHAKVASAFPPRGRLGEPLPSISDQSFRGTCVASAVSSLVECFEDCRRKVSVQYLDEVTRLVERAWVERNAKALVAGSRPENDFEAAFPEAVAQASLIVRTNGAGSDVSAAFVRTLAAKIAERIEADEGCRLKRCFEALEQYGVCREELWPYSPVSLKIGREGSDAIGAFPPGTHEDARRHRLVNGLYILRSPNNVDEIKGIVCGANGQRPMAVCVGLDLFEGCTSGTFTLPEVEIGGEGKSFVKQRSLGIHEVLIVAYEDDRSAPGGGWFTFMNSWGRDWGDGGFGKVSYAYVACFCREAGTILQDMVDYSPKARASNGEPSSRLRRITMICAVTICLVAAALSIALTIQMVLASRRRPPPPPPPQATVRAMTAVSNVVSPVAAVAQPAESGDEDDLLEVESIVDYRFRVSALCASPTEAWDVARILEGKHSELTVEDMRVDCKTCSFECTVTIEGGAGRSPDAIRIVKDYLKRKNCDATVRNWSVRRLR